MYLIGSSNILFKYTKKLYRKFSTGGTVKIISGYKFCNDSHSEFGIWTLERGALIPCKGQTFKSLTLMQCYTDFNSIYLLRCCPRSFVLYFTTIFYTIYWDNAPIILRGGINKLIYFLRMWFIETNLLTIWHVYIW